VRRRPPGRRRFAFVFSLVRGEGGGGGWGGFQFWRYLGSFVFWFFCFLEVVCLKENSIFKDFLQRILENAFQLFHCRFKGLKLQG
jgi:hypothetical protein